MNSVQNNIDWSWLNPYLDKICGDFYNPKRLLSYHKPLNFLQTSRSVGKTTIWSIICFLNYTVKGKRFWYMRRTDDETVLGGRSYFDDTLPIIKMYYPEEFKDYQEIYYEGGKFFVNKVVDGEIVKEAFGQIMPLSMVYKRKSVIQANANLILMDEFVAADPKEYLGKADNLMDEAKRLVNFYTTTDRGIGKAFKNETTIVCLGNSTTLFNPMFVYFDCVKYIQEDSRYISPKRHIWAIERLDKVAATEEIETSFGYLMASNDEQQKMYHNNTDEWTGTYVMNEKPQKAECYANIIFSGKTLGIWWSDYKQLWWIGSPDNSQKTYALDIEGHEMTDKELCYALNDFRFSDSIKRAYSRGRLFFKSYAIMKLILSYLKLQ